MIPLTIHLEPAELVSLMAACFVMGAVATLITLLSRGGDDDGDFSG